MGGGVQVALSKNVLVAGAVLALAVLGAWRADGRAQAAVPFQFSLQPETTSVTSVGQSVTVDVHIDDVTDLSAFGFRLSYNPSLVTVTGVTEGPLMASGGLQNVTCVGPTFSDASDEATYGCGSLGGSPVQGSGIAATVTFMSHTQGTAQVTFLATSATDALSNPLCGYVDAERSALKDCPWIGATIQIGTPAASGGSTSPTPTPPSSSNGGGTRSTPTPAVSGVSSEPPVHSIAGQTGVPATSASSGAANAAATPGSSPNSGVAGSSTGASRAVSGARAGSFGYGPQEGDRGAGQTATAVELLVVTGVGLLCAGIALRRRRRGGRVRA